MIPALAERPKTGRLYTDCLDALRHAKFAGDIEASAASTTVSSTDNSIYQLRPQAIMFPRRRADLVVIARLASEPRFRGVSFAMRGGGTGTNEHSLTDGIVIDMSRHMNRIVSIDPVKRTEGSLILLQDSFTSYFEPALLLDVIDLLLALGFKPFVAPLKPNGKALHIHGYLGAFERAAERNARHLCRLAASGVPPLGLDPSMTLCYQSEYPGALGAQKTPRMLLPQEWLSERLDGFAVRTFDGPETDYVLLPHCTERTNAQDSVRSWGAIFETFGLTLSVEGRRLLRHGGDLRA